ncbi:sigma factor [Kitasatospora sp. NPDC049258]|uniref:sigma factor n=1 Tax=Kitasatospora sp. NPDC049258 TaxID=3155394 RepID=UPI00343E676F
MSDRAPSRGEQVRQRLLDGEESALGELYDRYAPLVHGLAWRITDDQDAAEQLTREVFGTLWQHPHALGAAAGPLRPRLAELTRRLAAGPLDPRDLLRPQHPLGPQDPTDREESAGREDSLGPDEGLRRQVLECCLARRAAERPLPPWAAPFAAEAAKLDALLRDLGPGEWQEVAELPWHGGTQRWRPAQVLCHLAAVDGYLAPALGLPDPVPGAGQGAGPRVPEQHRPDDVLGRTRSLIEDRRHSAPTEVRELWRRQGLDLLRAAGSGADGGAPVDYGFALLPLADAFLDRAFECWIHGDDLARAVHYPYAPPAPQHLRLLVDLAARMLPHLLAALPGSSPGTGRLLRLVIDGPASGEWRIPLDGADDGRPPTAEMVLDGLEFCYLAAAHRDPDQLPVGRQGDRAAIREVLHAVPLLSRP